MLGKCLFLCFILSLCYAEKEKNGIYSQYPPEVCYDDVGCFPVKAPFYSQPDRPLPPPEDPATLKVTLTFFSRPNGNKSVDLHLPGSGKTKIDQTNFKGSRNRTIFILSGGGQSGQWPHQLKDALINRIDVNVFIVNTSYAYRGLQVFKGVSNTRVIGVMLANFIKNLKKSHGLNPEKQVWMIGYGVGAHLAGYTGERVKIARITGLDPMQEFFEGYPPEVRLDTTDAVFVDAVHTDARPLLPDIGFGFINPLGHVDFYPNGGHGQPGCKLPSAFDFQFVGEITSIIERFAAVWTSAIYCSHKRAFQIFIESVTDSGCTIWGHNGTMENFLRSISNGGSEGILLALTALSDPCDMNKCSPMGLHTPDSPMRGVKIVTTTADAPFCTGKDEPKNRGQVDTQISQWASSFFGYGDKH